MPSVANETNFKQEVLEVSKTVLVHFWTPWCGLCKSIAPLLETIQNNSHEKIKLVSIDADENFKLANIYRLRNVPTIMVFKNGELIEKLDNIKSRDRLKAALARIIEGSLYIS